MKQTQKQLEEHLDLISSETENAVSMILSSCDTLKNIVKSSGNKDELLEEISQIAQACIFQDIVSQRAGVVKKALQNNDKKPILSEEDKLKEGPALETANNLSQDDVDELFS